ncbi:MAG TPA: AAA family ATPase [Syntrophobacteraceae bacterium]|nr:AAA family ATPase [Syntrophobacteraceae bacterium]
MYRMNRVQIRGFRRLYDVDLEMRHLMVMIGANGVGKTSFLDAFSLLSASAAGELNSKLNGMGGVTDVLTIGRGEEISLSVDMGVPGHQPLKYDLHIVPKGPSYGISSETLNQDRGEPEPFMHIHSRHDDIRYFEIDERRLVRPDWDHNPLETSLSQVPKMFRQPEELRRILSSATQYHALDVGERAPVKLPQQMRPAVLPGEDGHDLVPFLYYLRESDTYRFEAVVDTLRSAFRDFKSLNFPPVAAGMLTMTWKENNFEKPLYTHQLSEGVLRFLWLISLLLSPALSTITMIDEPEVSLHPELLSLLADLMREASQRTQLIVATHSDRLIRFLKPSEVVVMDIMEDGCTSAVWADACDLDEWLAEYSLDEVWRMGRMGGRS